MLLLLHGVVRGSVSVLLEVGYNNQNRASFVQDNLLPVDVHRVNRAKLFCS